jgi:hypothetical protein
MEHMPAAGTAEAAPIYDRANTLADAYEVYPGDEERTAQAPR